MLRYLFFAFLIYLAYRLVFHFIIPIYKTTRQVKKQFREMHSRMQDNMNQQQANTQTSTSQTENKKAPAGDYIDRVRAEHDGDTDIAEVAREAFVHGCQCREILHSPATHHPVRCLLRPRSRVIVWR